MGSQDVHYSRVHRAGMGEAEERGGDGVRRCWEVEFLSFCDLRTHRYWTIGGGNRTRFEFWHEKTMKNMTSKFFEYMTARKRFLSFFNLSRKIVRFSCCFTYQYKICRAL